MKLYERLERQWELADRRSAPHLCEYTANYYETLIEYAKCMQGFVDAARGWHKRRHDFHCEAVKKNVVINMCKARMMKIRILNEMGAF